MKTLKPLFFIFTLSITTLNTQAIEPTITQQKQVASYYYHQIGNPQLTALLDSTKSFNTSILNNQEKTVLYIS